LDEATFRRFVNEEKNDFYNWIRYAVEDGRLAERIKRLRVKDDMAKEIMIRL
jgi:hypothetical protein